MSTLLNTFFISEIPFDMRHLHVLGKPETEQLHLIEAISSKWEKTGDLLGLSNDRISIIKEDNVCKGVEACCHAIISHWLHHDSQFNYERSWDGFHKLLLDLQMSELAESLGNIVFQSHHHHHHN